MSIKIDVPWVKKRRWVFCLFDIWTRFIKEHFELKGKNKKDKRRRRKRGELLEQGKGGKGLSEGSMSKAVLLINPDR